MLTWSLQFITNYMDVSTDEPGTWTTEGCSLLPPEDGDDEGVVRCSCNHLTNFAVLVVCNKIAKTPVVTKIDYFLSALEVGPV